MRRMQCKIEIDNKKKSSFSYSNEFSKEGKHIIKYSFKDHLIENLNYMFTGCSFPNLNLSNLNAKNIINMSQMVHNCSLIHLEISNFKAENLTNMRHLFSGCESLKSIIYLNLIQIMQLI